MNCLHCGAETTNGLALCERCRATVVVDLEFLPVYFRNLSRWRPGRAGTRRVAESRIPQGVLPQREDRVIGALDEAKSTLATWARCLVDDRPELTIQPTEAIGADLSDLDDHEQMRLVCLGFERHLTSISTLEWAGEFVKEVGQHEAMLRGLTETLVPGWYAGGCRRCGYATHVVPGLTWVTCGVCGTSTAASDRLEVILEEARDWVARPKALAEAVVALVMTEESVPRLYERIHKWGQRDRLTVFRKSDYAPKRYRLGEVLDAVLREGPTRAEEQERMGA